MVLERRQEILDLDDTRSVSRHFGATDECAFHLDRPNVLQHDDVGAVSRGERASAKQSVGSGGMDGRCTESHLRCRSRLCGEHFAKDIVDVPVTKERLRMAIIGTQMNERSGLRSEQRCKRGCVSCHGAFADQHVHSGSEFLAGLVERDRFMVGSRAGKDIAP